MRNIGDEIAAHFFELGARCVMSRNKTTAPPMLIRSCAKGNGADFDLRRFVGNAGTPESDSCRGSPASQRVSDMMLNRRIAHRLRKRRARCIVRRCQKRGEMRDSSSEFDAVVHHDQSIGHRAENRLHTEIPSCACAPTQLALASDLLKRQTNAACATHWRS